MDFISFLRDISIPENNENHVFRGQANIEWPLVTCYARFFEKTQKEKSFSIDLFTTMLTQFINQMSEYQGKDYNTIPEHHKIAMAQHFGLPTPLLDWTKSPFIALYFAASENIYSNEEREFVVFSLNINNLQTEGYIYNPETDSSLLKNNIDFRFINTNNFYSRRISNQQGCFTFHNFKEDLFTKLTPRIKK